MNDLKRTSDRMRRLEVTAQKKGWLNDIHPTSKLFVTLAYIILVISINQYNLPGLLGMCIYPVVLFVIGEISIKEFLYRLRMILPLVCLVGIFNPVFDKRAMFYIGECLRHIWSDFYDYTYVKGCSYDIGSISSCINNADRKDMCRL